MNYFTLWSKEWQVQFLSALHYGELQRNSLLASSAGLGYTIHRRFWLEHLWPLRSGGRGWADYLRCIPQACRLQVRPVWATDALRDFLILRRPSEAGPAWADWACPRRESAILGAKEALWYAFVGSLAVTLERSGREAVLLFLYLFHGKRPKNVKSP